MNITLRFFLSMWPAQNTLKMTNAGGHVAGREYDVLDAVERITVRISSREAIVVEFDEELREYRVIHVGEENEIVLSILEEAT